MQSVLILCGVLLFQPGCSSQPKPVVEIETSMGSIKVELYPNKAPITVKNFLAYVDDKHYDGTIFHRVMEEFMIQGGGFEPDKLGEGKPTKRPPIKNEASNGFNNARGTIAMARTDDPDSATDQFFINVVDNSKGLDRKGNLRGQEGYAVFGKVIEGMDVVDRIREVQTETRIVQIKGEKGKFEHVPVQDVIIKSIRRVEPKK